MKKSICALLILISASSIAQSFGDCSDSYYDSYKKIEFDLMRYNITDKVGDSLRNVLDSEFQTCIIGKKIDYNGLVSRSGRDYNAANLRGKVVLFNFWSVNCGPCIAEIPFLNRLYASYQGNKEFMLVSILLDDEDKLDKLLQRGVIRGGINFEVLSNDKISIKENLKFVKAIPMNLFVDREGKIFTRTVGAIQGEESFEKVRSIVDRELLK